MPGIQDARIEMLGSGELASVDQLRKYKCNIKHGIKENTDILDLL